MQRQTPLQACLPALLRHQQPVLKARKRQLQEACLKTLPPLLTMTQRQLKQPMHIRIPMQNMQQCSCQLLLCQLGLQVHIPSPNPQGLF